MVEADTFQSPQWKSGAAALGPPISEAMTTKELDDADATQDWQAHSKGELGFRSETGG